MTDASSSATAHTDSQQRAPAHAAQAPATPSHAGDSPRRRLSRRLLAALFIAAGANHFVMPRAYRRIVPPRLQGDASAVVALSGIAEIAGGAGVLVPGLRRVSGAWLIALLAAVFPANVFMAGEPERFSPIPRWALYARLPLQPLMMWWAWRVTQP